MTAVRIKMPPEFTDKEHEKSSMQIEFDALRKEKDPSIPHVYELSWDEGGTISVHATEEGAYRKAALIIVEHCKLLMLERIHQEFVDEEGCDCCCHLECICEDNACKCDGLDCDCPPPTHDQENEDCNHGDCGTDGQCCVTTFDGKEAARGVREAFRNEQYQLLVCEWNSFWLQLIETQENNVEDASENVVLNVHRRVILP